MVLPLCGVVVLFGVVVVLPASFGCALGEFVPGSHGGAT